MRFNSPADSRTNAVEFTTTIPTTNQNVTASEPGFVYAGGYSDNKQQMDFGLSINGSNQISIFMKQNPPAPGTFDTKGYVTLDLLSQLNLNSDLLDPPITTAFKSKWSKIYPVITNPGSGIQLRSWTSNSRVYLEITTALIVRFYADRYDTHPEYKRDPISYPLILRYELPDYKDKALKPGSGALTKLPVISFPITGWGNAGDPQAMKAMVSIGQKQYNPVTGVPIVNPSGGRSFTGVMLSGLRYGTATADGTFTPKVVLKGNIPCLQPDGVVPPLTGGDPTSGGVAGINIMANKGFAVLSIAAPPNNSPLTLEARPGDANIPATITASNTGAAGSLLRVNYGDNFTAIFPAGLTEIFSGKSVNYSVPALNCPAIASTQPVEKRVYVRAFTGETETIFIKDPKTNQDVPVPGLKWTPTQNVLIKLTCNGNPALSPVTIAYALIPPKVAVGKTVTGTAKFTNNGTRPLEWTATLPAGITWLKLNPVSGTTDPTKTASVAFTATCTKVGQLMTDIIITNKNVPEQKSTEKVVVECEKGVKTSIRMTTPYNGSAQLCPRVKGALDYEFVGVTGTGTWQFLIDGIPANIFEYTDSGSTITFASTRSCNLNVGNHNLQVKVIDSQGVVIATSADAAFAVTSNQWAGFISNDTNNCAGLPGIAMDLTANAAGATEQRQNAVQVGNALAVFIKGGLTYTFQGIYSGTSVGSSTTYALPAPFEGDPVTTSGRTGFYGASFKQVCPDPALLRTQSDVQQLLTLVDITPITAAPNPITLPLKVP